MNGIFRLNMVTISQIARKIQVKGKTLLTRLWTATTTKKRDVCSTLYVRLFLYVGKLRFHIGYQQHLSHILIFISVAPTLHFKYDEKLIYHESVLCIV